MAFTLAWFLVCATVASAGLMWYFTGARTYKDDKNPGSKGMGLLVFAAAFAAGIWLDAYTVLSDFWTYGLHSNNAGLVITTLIAIGGSMWLLGNMTYSWLVTGSVAS